MAKSDTGLAPAQVTSSSGEVDVRRRVLVSGLDVMHYWWLRAVTLAAAGYILTSQTLSDMPNWSRLGIVFACILLFLLGLGGLVGVWRFKLGGWIWIPSVFVGYCLLRTFSRTGYGAPLDVLSALVSAYLGGIGVAVALQAGVRFRALVYAQLAAILCQVAAGFFGVGQEGATGDAGRFAGLTGNANELGLQLTLGACMIWLLPREAGRFACSFAFFSVAFAVATTGSRQALFAALVFLILVLIQTWAAIKSYRLALSLVVGGLCLVGILLTPLLVERAREITAVQRALEYNQDSSYHKRVVMIRQGLRLWQQAPLMGNGLDSFRDLSGQGTYAHNDYIELLCDLGLVGAFFFYAIHGNILIRATRLPGSLRICCWLFVALLLALDTACVGYKRKQTVMLLMVLTTITASPRFAFNPIRKRTCGSLSGGQTPEGQAESAGECVLSPHKATPIGQ